MKSVTTAIRRRNRRGEGARLADEIVAGARAIVDRTGLSWRLVADILVDFGVLDPAEAAGEHALAT